MQLSWNTRSHCLGLAPFALVSTAALFCAQVAPCIGAAGPCEQQQRAANLQSLMQHAAAQSRQAPHVKDSRASPAPSCPTPIGRRHPTTQAMSTHAGRQECAGGLRRNQALSAPLLLAQKAAQESGKSPASVEDGQPAAGQGARRAQEGTGMADMWSKADQPLQHDGSSIHNSSAQPAAEAAAEI